MSKHNGNTEQQNEALVSKDIQDIYGGLPTANDGPAPEEVVKALADDTGLTEEAVVTAIEGIESAV